MAGFDETQTPGPAVAPVADSTDPFEVYRDFIGEIPDPAAALHDEFVQTMPLLDADLRVKAAQNLAEQLEDKQPADYADSMISDNPFVQRRVLELCYGEEMVTDREIMLRAIREGSVDGEQEAADFLGTMDDVLEEDPTRTLDQLYGAEVGGIVTGIMGEFVDPADEPQVAAEYKPDIFRHFKRITRPVVEIGGVAIKKTEDLHKLNLAEFREPWKSPTTAVIEALESGKHVLLGARRNSGKTHIFPSILKELAPADWEVSEMTNNHLRGGEDGLGFGSNTASDFFSWIASGQDIQAGIAFEQREHTRQRTDYKRAASTEMPARKVLIVDEIQHALLRPDWREAGVVERLATWADANDTQLVLISAIADQRQVPEVKQAINEALPETRLVDLEAYFERPEYPKPELIKLLGQVGVAPEAMRWIAEDPAARPLRSMRGLYVMHSELSNPMAYIKLEDTRLRSVEQVGKFMEQTKSVNGLERRMIDYLANLCAGSGVEMVALAEAFDLRPPQYGFIGYAADTTPEDIN